MAAISQQVPNWIHGISKLPDERKELGYLVDAKNVLPDLVEGLQKRPGGKFVTVLDKTTDDVATWFHMQSNKIPFIGRIDKNGAIQLWNCIDGQIHATEGIEATGRQQITGKDGSSIANALAYLKNDTDRSTDNYLKADYKPTDIQTLTISSATFLANRNRKVRMSDTVNFQGDDVDYTDAVRHNEAYIDLKLIAYNKQYALDIASGTNNAAKVSTKRVTKLDAIWINNEGTEQSLTQDGGNARYTNREIFTINPAGHVCQDCESSPNYTNKRHHVFRDKNGASQKYVSTDKTNLRFDLKMQGNPYNKDSTSYGTQYELDATVLHGGEGWSVGDYFTLSMGTGTGRASFKITVKATETIESFADIATVRPAPSSSDANAILTAEGILEDIRNEIEKKSENGARYKDSAGFDIIPHIHTRRIGSGIYLKADGQRLVDSNGTGSNPGTHPEVDSNGNDIKGRDFSFTLTASDGKLITVFTDKINDVTDLPTSCRHGYIVKVTNTEAEEDDYYLEFQTKSDNMNGPGVWEETVKPGIRTQFDASTMPHELRMVNDSSTIGYHFELWQSEWEPRLVGDQVTNPQPSFAWDKSITGTDKDKIGYKIQNILFFRNRLTFLSEDSVILSQPGDYYNFWVSTAMTISPIDTVDISASTTTPEILQEGIEVNRGLLLFSADKQFMLTTDNDVLTPQTAKIINLSSYSFNVKTKPFLMGTSIGFLNASGTYSKLFEMLKITTTTEPQVIEQSKIITNSLPSTIDSVAESKENGLLLFTTSDTETDIWGYRYFNTGDKRVHSCWFRWRLNGIPIYHCIIDGTYYAIVKIGSNKTELGIQLQLQNWNLKNQTNIKQCGNTYNVHMDNITDVDESLITYDDNSSSTTYKTSKIILPDNFHAQDEDSYKQVVIYATAGPMAGQSEMPTVQGSSCRVEGDWRTSVVWAGYLFDMKIEFPKIYWKQQVGDNLRADPTSSTVVHRMKFNLGPTGYYSTRLKRKNRKDWVKYYEAASNYNFYPNCYNITPEGVRVLPIHAKSTDFKVLIESKHVTPFTLNSSTWEGDYNTRYYTRQ